MCGLTAARRSTDFARILALALLALPSIHTPAFATLPDAITALIAKRASGAEAEEGPWAAPNTPRGASSLEDGTGYSWPVAWSLDHPKLRITNYPDEDSSPAGVDYMGQDFTYNGHRGTDININSFREMDEGVPVLAATNGRVGYTEDGFYDREISAPMHPWNVVMILHGDGTMSVYGHLRKNSVTVRSGEYVRAGQMVGLIGSSGFTLMPHLHFEIWQIYCGTAFCEPSYWVDPWSGARNTAPSLWESQEDYVGDDHLRVYDLSVSTPTAFAEADRGQRFSALKERPSQPVVFGASEPFLAVWTLVSGRIGDPFRIAVHRPDGSLYATWEWSVDVLDRAWGQGWHARSMEFAFNGTIPLADYGEWYVELLEGSTPVRTVRFAVGATTQYAPRFWPTAGKSFHLSGEAQRDTLSVSSLGAPMSDLTFALENAPSNVSLSTDEAGRNIVSIGPAQADLAAVRSREFAVVATDPAGRRDRMRYHLVNDQASTLGSPPVVTAPPSVTVSEGDTLVLDVSVSDPDGDPIAALEAELGGLPATDGATFVAGPGNTSGRLTWPTHVGEAGSYTVALRARTSLGADGYLKVGFQPIVQLGSASTVITVEARIAARAFATGGDRVIRLSSERPRYCIGVEPQNASFGPTEIDLASVRLTSHGTGSVDWISPVFDKTSVVGDRDHNSVSDVVFCFTREDLRSLFSELLGRETVSATIQGNLLLGAQFHAAADLDVVAGGGRSNAPTVSPNPLNPEALLTLRVARPGPLRVLVFDTQGRLVRTLMDSGYVPAGPLRLRVDGRNDAGRPLGSGVYLFQAVGTGAATSGRFVILK